MLSGFNGSQHFSSASCTRLFMSVAACLCTLTTCFSSRMSHGLAYTWAHFSVSGAWVAFCDFLDDDLRTLPGMTISVRAKLLTARHVNLRTRQDLSEVPVTVKAVWTRAADPAAAKRRLSPTSRSFLEFWRAWAPDVSASAAC